MFDGYGPLIATANYKIIKKFVGPFDSNFQGVWLQNIGPLWSNKASKSLFPNLHGNHFEIQNSYTVCSHSDPNRLSLPNFVKIGRKTAEELINGKSVQDCLHMSFLKLWYDLRKDTCRQSRFIVKHKIVELCDKSNFDL